MAASATSLLGRLNGGNFGGNFSTALNGTPWIKLLGRCFVPIAAPEIQVKKSPPDSWWAFFHTLQGWPPVRPTYSMLMSAIRSTFFPTGACAFSSPSHLQWRPRTRRQSWRVFASPSRQCISRQIDRYRTFYVRRPARDPIQSVNAETECNIRVGHGNLYESLSSENCGGYAQHLCHRQTGIEPPATI